jgi:Protein of unknown function (DUF3311)
MRPVYLLAALPFLGLLGGIPFVNRVTPFVLGLPFILFWIVLWVVISSLIMWVIYTMDPRNRAGEDR